MNWMLGFLKGMSTLIVLGVIVAALLNLSIILGIREKTVEYKETTHYTNAMAVCSASEESPLCMEYCADALFASSWPGCCDASPGTACIGKGLEKGEQGRS